MAFYVIMDDGICHLMLSYVLLLNYSKIVVKIFNGDVENIGFELSVSLFVNLGFFELLNCPFIQEVWWPAVSTLY